MANNDFEDFNPDDLFINEENLYHRPYNLDYEFMASQQSNTYMSYDFDTESTLIVEKSSLEVEPIKSELKRLCDFFNTVVFHTPAELTITDIYSQLYDGLALQVFFDSLSKKAIKKEHFINPSCCKMDHIVRLKKISDKLKIMLKNADIVHSEWWNPYLINENFIPTILLFIIGIIESCTAEFRFNHEIAIPVLILRKNLQTGAVTHINQRIVVSNVSEFYKCKENVAGDDEDLVFAESLVNGPDSTCKMIEDRIVEHYNTILSIFERKVTNLYDDFKSSVNFVLLFCYQSNVAIPLNSISLHGKSDSELRDNFDALFYLLNTLSPNSILARKITFDLIASGDKLTMLSLHKKLNPDITIS